MRIINIFPLSIFANKIVLSNDKKDQMISAIRKMKDNSKKQIIKKKAMLGQVIHKDLKIYKKYNF